MSREDRLLPREGNFEGPFTKPDSHSISQGAHSSLHKASQSGVTNGELILGRMTKLWRCSLSHHQEKVVHGNIPPQVSVGT